VKPLDESVIRDLQAERAWKPSSVNLALAAVDRFNRFLGLGRRT
jgi:hypothetical protein